MLIEPKIHQEAVFDFIVPFIDALRWRTELGNILVSFCEDVKDLQSKMMAKIWYKQARVQFLRLHWF